jgi:plastocyanin
VNAPGNHRSKLRLLGLAALSLWVLTRAAGFGQNADRNGSIEGIVTFEGKIPKSSVTDDAGRRHDLVEVDPRTKTLRDMVLYVARSDGAELPRPATLRSDATALVDQIDYAFAPRVIAVREGQPVTFRNSDPANHNVRASARTKSNEFNVFTGVDGKYEHRFLTESNNAPIRLGCDIHPWMAAWVFVFNHPFFSVTDEGGRFRITELPPGEYQLHMVQPAIRYREQRKVRVNANETSKIEVVVQAPAAKGS